MRQRVFLKSPVRENRTPGSVQGRSGNWPFYCDGRLTATQELINMASPIAETWIYATMIIENDWGEFGTGFLVSRQISDTQSRIFLVSNKHVLNQNPTLRLQATEVKVYLNYRESDGNVVGKQLILPLQFGDGSNRWREHPDRDVDVIAFDVTQIFVEHPQVERKWATYADIADREKIKEFEITIGEEVMVIGYPKGLKQGNTNFPLVRAGLIATRIGDSLIDEVEENGSKRPRTVRGVLIDGATIPGSSGSPVVLKPISGRTVKGNLQLGSVPQLLLGIIAETMYAPMKMEKWEIPSFAGLGLAFDAETIQETIELFFS